MKVLFLLGSLNTGGAETLVLDIFRNYRYSEDFQITGLYRKKGNLESDYISTNIPFNYFPVKRNVFLYIIRLRQFVIGNKINLIHTHQLLDGFIALLATFNLSVKVVQSVHSFDFNLSKKQQWFRKWVLSRSDKNIFVSYIQLKYYNRKYNLMTDKQFVVYNGINFNKFDNLQKQNINYNLRKELNIQDSTLLMGMVGNFNEGRDQMTVCRFLKLLNEQAVDFHFVFVGKRVENTAQRYDDCVSFCQKNNLSQRVTFAGVRNDVPAILSQLDAFIYSTEHDTFGIAVVEAIASGTPVFVNDWEVMNEITEGGKLAVIYKTKDENDLLEKFMLFLQKQEEYVSRAKENAEIVRKKYSIEKHIENLKEVYLSLH